MKARVLLPIMMVMMQGCTLYKFIATVEPAAGSPTVATSTAPASTLPPDSCESLKKTWSVKFDEATAADDSVRQARISELLDKLDVVCDKPSDELWKQVHELIKELDAPTAS